MHRFRIVFLITDSENPEIDLWTRMPISCAFSPIAKLTEIPSRKSNDTATLLVEPDPWIINTLDDRRDGILTISIHQIQIVVAQDDVKTGNLCELPEVC
jgi:hypothetical protein